MDDESVDQAVQRSFDRDAIAVAVVKLAGTVEPDGHYDPADDPRPEAQVLALAELLGNVSSRDAAVGIQQALWAIHERWTVGS